MSCVFTLSYYPEKLLTILAQNRQHPFSKQRRVRKTPFSVPTQRKEAKLSQGLGPHPSNNQATASFSFWSKIKFLWWRHSTAAKGTCHQAWRPELNPQSLPGRRWEPILALSFDLHKHAIVCAPVCTNTHTHSCTHNHSHTHTLTHTQALIHTHKLVFQAILSSYKQSPPGENLNWLGLLATLSLTARWYCGHKQKL